MATGGEASTFCSSNRAHKETCEFFAQGGEATVPLNPADDVQAALTHGGADMLFNGRGYNTAFGSRMSPLAQKDGTEEEVNHKRFVDRIKKGHKMGQDALQSVFGNGPFPDYPRHDPEALKEHIRAGAGPQHVVADNPEDPLASSMPDHNIMLNAAKGRIGNYLNGLRPHEIETKLPFDPSVPNKRSDKDYDRALDMAAHPLSVLKRVKDGRLTPQDVKSFSTMYPEMYQKLKDSVSQEVMKFQIEGKRPPHAIRQSLSLLLGAHMDSTVTPQAIMAAQAVFAPKQVPPSPATQGKNKKGTATLTKASEQYATRDQKSQMRANQ